MTFVFKKMLIYYNIHIAILMNEFTISIIGNKIFFEIINELKLFSKFNIKFYANHDLYIQDSNKENQITLFFDNQLSLKIKSEGKTLENIKIPFKILDFEKKITLLIAKNKFKKNSLINLSGYIIDKNERKIKKNDLQTLYLSIICLLFNSYLIII